MTEATPDSIASNPAKAEPLEQTSKQPLSLFTKAGWGFGTLAVSIGFTAQNMLLLRFMTDFVGIAAAAAGLIIAFSKIYDAITDPVMGVISDRTPARFGRRRPYLLAGGALLAISLISMFNVPGGLDDLGRMIYMAGVLLLFATAYTMFNVPYLAMPAEMTSGPDERSDLIQYRIYAVAVSGILASFFGPVIITEFGGGERGHQVMSYVLAPIIMLAAILCFWATRNAPYTERQKRDEVKFMTQMKTAMQNKPFFLLLAIKFCTLLNIGVQSVMPFFFIEVLELTYAFLGTYVLCSQLTMMASQPFWIWVSKNLGKRNTYMIALGLAMVTPLSWLVAAPGDPAILLFARAIIGGVAAGGILLMGQSLLPDTIEWDYLKTGLRREGIFAGLYTTVEKLSAAVGVALVGGLLGAMGYVQSTGGVEVEQPESAIRAIVLSIAFIPMIIDITCMAFLTRFKLTNESLSDLRRESPYGNAGSN